MEHFKKEMRELEIEREKLKLRRIYNLCALPHRSFPTPELLL